MNPLLTLMHDTGRSMMIIDTFAALIQQRLQTLNIDDQQLNECIANIRLGRDELMISLDLYYTTIKGK